MASANSDLSEPDPAEATDGASLGEKAGDEPLPGTVDFPPTTPYGVGPAGSVQDPDRHDSVEQRSEREEPEGGPPPHEAVRLLDPNPNGLPDLEADAVADDVAIVGLVSPEEAAMHIDDEG